MSNNQIDHTSGLAINCRNCIHCERSPYGSAAGLDKCMKSGGDYCELIHSYPNLSGHICKNYSSWAPREKTILELISDKIRKMLST